MQKAADGVRFFLDQLTQNHMENMNKEAARRELERMKIDPRQTAKFTPRENHEDDPEMLRWIEETNALLEAAQAA